PSDFFQQLAAMVHSFHTINPVAVAIAVASLALVVFWPKAYAMGAGRSWNRWMAHVPGTVIALALGTLAVSVFDLSVETIGTRFGGLPQSLPVFALPDFSWELAKQLVAPTLTIALLGAVESLLCARIADNMIEDRHDPNQELMAQGVANFVTPFFGGIPATGTIARTVTNIKSGAVSPIAGIVHSVTLLAVILIAAPLATNIPLATLAAILMFVAWNMGEWRQFARLRQFKGTYRVVLLATFFLTVIFDLTVAIEVGLILSSLFFIYRISELTRVERISLAPVGELDFTSSGIEAYRMYGSLFFGAVSKLEALTDPARYAGSQAPKVVILDMLQLISLDTTGLDAIDVLRKQLVRNRGTLILAGPNEQPLSLLRRSGFIDALGEANVVPDLKAAAARATALLNVTPTTG
ncbi:MAG: SulP family inorganic anion transporter, partial [Burkholderiaceae bacterium]